MAAIAKSGTPSICTAAPPTSCSVSGLVAGEAINSGDACYIKNADGKVYKSTAATATDPAALVHGYAPTSYSAGDAMSLYWDVNFAYDSGLTPGKPVFLSGSTAGALVDAAADATLAPIGLTIDAKRIWLTRQLVLLPEVS